MPNVGSVQLAVKRLAEEIYFENLNAGYPNDDLANWLEARRRLGVETERVALLAYHCSEYKFSKGFHVDHEAIWLIVEMDLYVQHNNRVPAP